MRGVIPHGRMNQINSDLANSVQLEDRMPIHWSYHPLGSNGQRPAEVLREFWDAWHLLNETRVALIEAEACKIWHEEFRSPPDQIAAAYFCRYYSDDASLRSYASCYHVVNAIKLHFGLRRKGGSNRRSPLKKLLASLRDAQPPPEPLAWVELLDQSPEWNRCEGYRNRWVHSERPNLKGLGPAHYAMHTYTRTDEYEQITFGGGDPIEEQTLADLRGTVRGAYSALFSLIENLADFFTSEVTSGLPADFFSSEVTSALPAQG